MRAEERIKLAEEEIEKLEEMVAKSATSKEVEHLLTEAKWRLGKAKEAYEKGEFHISFYEGHCALKSALDGLQKLQSS